MAKVLLKNIRSGKRKALITDLNSIARKEIEKSLDTKVKPALVKSHEIIVTNWENKPGFQARKSITSNEISVNIFPTGPNKKIWVFVDEGTKPHLIVPKRVPLLSFKTGYQPKTLASPARTVSGGGKATGPRVYAKKVQHPGSAPRNFTKQIAKDIKPGFQKEIESAFRRVSRRVEE